MHDATESKALSLLHGFLGCDPSTELELGINHKSLKYGSSSHGDFFFSRKTTAMVKKKLRELNCEDVATILTIQDASKYFSKAFINPQAQLCLGLNRPIAFTDFLLQVAKSGLAYGQTFLSSSESSRSIILINDTLLLKNISGTDGCGPATRGCGCTDSTSNDISLEEGRCILATNVLSNLLRTSGYTVHQPHYNSPSLSGMSVGNPVRQILHPYSFSDPSAGLPTNEIATHFISSLLSPSGVLEDTLTFRNAKVDAGGFLTANKLLERSGFYRNIQDIQVTDENGSMLPPSLLACEALRAEGYDTVDGTHVICHVTSPRKAFLVHQAMVLHEMYQAARGNASSLCFLLIGEVKCMMEERGEATFTDILTARQRHVAELYAVKYGDNVTGPGLKGNSERLAEAIMKFELLLPDTQSMVKIDFPEPKMCLPHSGQGQGSRFPGASVLYNYARLSAILNRHQQLISKGTFPPLPSLEQVDFSLLSDEMEWQLFFHFVVCYPATVREAAVLKKKKGAVEGVCVEASIKKVCLFLVNFSHLFSSYYSRVKILMSPEPHLLPLIHARLHLLSALRQVMHNALLLLDIQPMDEL